MTENTKTLVSKLLDAKDSDSERTAALLLVEYLRDSHIDFEVTFKEINRLGELSNEAYLENPRGIVLLDIEDDHIVWDPVDRVNTDMFFTE